MHGGKQHDPAALHDAERTPAAVCRDVWGLTRRSGWAALALIAPENAECVLCGEESAGAPLCPACKAALATEALDAADEGAVWRHRGAARQLVLRLKFHCEQAAAEALAEGLAEKARSLPLPPGTVVTSVTMPRLRRYRRGIDHGRVLAEAAARQLGLPFRPLLRRRFRLFEHTQRGLNAAGRLRNLRGCFTGTGCAGLHVLLIDDVTTTGATGRACTEALQTAGAASVRVLTATRAQHRRAPSDEA